MDDIENRLERVLELEEREFSDWPAIKAECDEIIRLINEKHLESYRGTIAYRFAEDYDVREKSDEYAFSQRRQLKEWLQG